MDDISKKDKLFSLSFLLFNMYLFFCASPLGTRGGFLMVRRFPMVTSS